MKDISYCFNIAVVTFALAIYFLIHLLFTTLLWANDQKSLIYDSGGKRNPFIPVLDKNSPTGIRTNFVPAQGAIKLPVEIKIEGILWNGEQYFTILNGQVKQRGGNLDEIKIKEIKQDKIIFEYSEKEFVILFKKGEE